MKSILDLQAEYRATLEAQRIHPRSLDYRRLDAHLDALRTLEALDGNCYQIFDLHRRTHVYFSAKFNSYFGLKEGEDLDERTHPDDLYRMMEMGIRYLRFFYSRPVEERTKYKLTNDFRLARPGGGYTRVTKNYTALELDTRGNLWLALCSLAISVETDASLPLKSRIVNVETGAPLLFPTGNMATAYEAPFSEREIQVLDLIARGYSSKQIAPVLAMSVHTVNTHRQNIIRKAGMKNSTEAVKYASDLGLLVGTRG